MQKKGLLIFFRIAEVPPDFQPKNWLTFVWFGVNAYICRKFANFKVNSMLIRFTVGNYLSFKEPATLSLVSTSLRETAVADADAMFHAGGALPPLLHGAAIYGANASGKSNFVKAFSAFKWLAMNSMKELRASETVNLERFMLSSVTASEPSLFEATFCSAGYVYRYGFEMGRDSVAREWLYRKSNKKRAKEVEMFYRDNGQFTMHASYAIAKHLVANNMVRCNALLLSVAAQFNDGVAADVVRWLGDTIVITNDDDEKMWQWAALKLDDPVMRKRIVDFSKYADFGIDDIYKVNDEVVSSHTQYDDDGNASKRISFPFSANESEGTIRYFKLAYPIIDALDHGKRIVVDELDCKMHPVLTSRIIELFNSGATNPHNAQIVFTLHDTNVLGAKLLRRDQVWFTQKDAFGASMLYSLADYKVRSNAPFEKDYILGKYGATPVTGDFSRLFLTQSEQNEQI